MPDANEETIKKQRAAFIKAFDNLADATEGLKEISRKNLELLNKQIQAMNQQTETVNGLIEALMMPKDGMRDVIDEVLEEIRGLREDLRAVVKVGGLEALRAILGQLPRR